MKQNGKLRWVPSYLRRQGKVTPGQKRALRDHWSTYGREFEYGATIALLDLFPEAGARDSLFLEIGFGMGENLLHQAQRHPDAWILGIEVHQPGIGSAIAKLFDEKIRNVRIMRGDARLIVTDFLAGEMVFDRVSILFPDPWPDPESAHRRIVQDDLLDLIEARTHPGAELHIATDINLYRQHCRDLLDRRSATWKEIEEVQLSDYRCRTKYEQKGRQAGRKIHDLIFKKQP